MRPRSTYSGRLPGPSERRPKSPPAPKQPDEAANKTSTPYPPEIMELLELAKRGDSAALEQIHSLIDQNPEHCDRIGDLANTAEILLFQQVAGNDPLGMEALRRKAAALRAEISSPEDSKLTQLSVQRVIACWLQLQYLDVIDAMTANRTPSQATQWARQQESAERRYQVALKSLGLSRRISKDASRPTAPSANA